MTRPHSAGRTFPSTSIVFLLLIVACAICCGPGDNSTKPSLVSSSKAKNLTVSDADLPVVAGNLSRGPLPRIGLTAHILEDGTVTLTRLNERTGVHTSDPIAHSQVLEDYDEASILVRVHRKAAYIAVSDFIDACSDPSIQIWSFYLCNRRKESGEAAWVVLNRIYEETVSLVAVHLSPDSQAQDFRVNERSGLNREEALSELYQFLQPPRNKGEQLVMTTTGDPSWSGRFGFVVELMTMRPHRGQGQIEGCGWVDGLVLETPYWQ